MANAFEDFVQLELGKRPYSSADGSLEALLVRRGPGPRQLTFVEIGEGQILGKVNGILQGVTPTGEGGVAVANMVTHKQVEANVLWTIVHGKNCRYFNYNVFRDDRAVIPGEVIIVDANTITISFNYPASGHVVFSFDLSAS